MARVTELLQAAGGAAVGIAAVLAPSLLCSAALPWALLLMVAAMAASALLWAGLSWPAVAKRDPPVLEDPQPPLPAEPAPAQLALPPPPAWPVLPAAPPAAPAQPQRLLGDPLTVQLMCAAESGDEAGVLVALAAGADPNGVLAGSGRVLLPPRHGLPCGATPLHAACFRGRLACVRRLLAAGANPTGTALYAGRQLTPWGCTVCGIGQLGEARELQRTLLQAINHRAAASAHGEALAGACTSKLRRCPFHFETPPPPPAPPNRRD